MPTAGAIGRARLRLGPEPLKALFARVCRTVADRDTVGAWYRQWRLGAVDGTGLAMPCSTYPLRLMSSTPSQARVTVA